MARDDSAQVRTEVMDTPRTLWRLGFYPARRRLGGATTEHSMGMIEKEVYTLIIRYLQYIWVLVTLCSVGVKFTPTKRTAKGHRQ